jgi:hypothetical protein
MSRAEKFLEGFKLGALGAGRKPVTGTDDETPVVSGSASKVRIIKEGTEKKNGNAFEGPQSYPYIYWEDKDGWRYVITMNQNLTKYSLFLSGGPNLVVEEDKRDPFLYAVMSGKVWMYSAITKWTREQVFPVYEQLVSTIKSQGIEGLFKKKLLKKFKAFSDDQAKFDAWLSERKDLWGIS